MKLTLTIETDNAAFEGNWTRETARILKHAADKLRSEGTRTQGFRLLDINGNTVGEVAVQDE